MSDLKGLVLSLKIGERVAVQVGGVVCWVGVSDSGSGCVKLVFDAPQSVIIIRDKFIRSATKCQL